MSLTIALVSLAFAVTVATYRVLRGPSWSDRITAFDFLTVALSIFIVVIALKTGFESFVTAALLVSILGFLSTVALTRYLLSGKVMK